jgi:membrane-associated protease RseP (regulator of RpoE activity)
MLLHPVAVAAWVGMFATALNLLPGGQLDGGHIVYSLWPRAHRWVSVAVVTVLALGIPRWNGWIVWAVLLLLTGTRHPQVMPRFSGFAGAPYDDPWAPLGAGRALLAVFALVILLVTIMPTPFYGEGLNWFGGR